MSARSEREKTYGSAKKSGILDPLKWENVRNSWYASRAEEAARWGDADKFKSALEKISDPDLKSRFLSPEFLAETAYGTDKLQWHKTNVFKFINMIPYTKERDQTLRSLAEDAFEVWERHGNSFQLIMMYASEIKDPELKARFLNDENLHKAGRQLIKERWPNTNLYESLAECASPLMRNKLYFLGAKYLTEYGSEKFKEYEQKIDDPDVRELLHQEIKKEGLDKIEN